jgi:hypothetical protein
MSALVGMVQYGTLRMRLVITEQEDVAMSEQAGKKTFTLGTESARLLEELAERFYADNQTETVRVALRHLAAQLGMGETTWVMDGYVPTKAKEAGTCHCCGDAFGAGEVVYRPVFRRGSGPSAQSQLPQKEIRFCTGCVDTSSKHWDNGV